MREGEIEIEREKGGEKEGMRKGERENERLRERERGSSSPSLARISLVCFQQSLRMDQLDYFCGKKAG